jgi:hypothetical protein
MLIELKEVLCQELQCLYSKTDTVLWEGTLQKSMDVVSYIFIALEISKYIVQKCLYTLYIVHTYSTGPYVHYMYSHTLYRMRSFPQLPGNILFGMGIVCLICASFFRSVTLV